MSYGITLHVWGDLACFTRPEMKVERVSYDVITPSAARGVLEAIYWKPQIRWIIDRIHILKPIRFTSLRRNEVAAKASARSAADAMNGNPDPIGIYVDDRDQRQQRASILLRDVAYLIDAHFDVISGSDTPAKHISMFNRRAAAGQCFQRPYLGCREFDAHFELVADTPPVSQLAGTPAGNRDLGFMLHDIDFADAMTPRFYRAELRDGVIVIPPLHAPEVVQ